MASRIAEPPADQMVSGNEQLAFGFVTAMGAGAPCAGAGAAVLGVALGVVGFAVLECLAGRFARWVTRWAG